MVCVGCFFFSSESSFSNQSRIAKWILIRKGFKDFCGRYFHQLGGVYVMWCKQGEETGFLVPSSARGDFNADVATRGKLGPAIIGGVFWNSNDDVLVVISKCMGRKIL